MDDIDTSQDERQRRILQEYIFHLEDARDKAEELAAVHEKLKESQDLLMAVLGSTTHGISLIRNDTIIWCNTAFASILGWKQEELIGRSPGIICSPGCRESKPFLWGGRVWGIGNATHECDFLHKDGHHVPCLASRRLKDENDPGRGYVLSLTDFTQLKNAETALKTAYEKLEERSRELMQANEQLGREINEHKETERKLNQYQNRLEELVRERTEDLRKANEQLQQEISRRRQQQEALRKLEELESSILGAISHAVIGLKERSIIFANDGVERIFGWKPEDIIGKSTRLLYRTEEEYSHLGGIYEVLEKQRLHGDEIWCRHKDGRDIICRFTASRIGTSLADKHIVVTYEDVTDQKRVENALRESEEKYRNIFENTLEGIFQAASDGRVLSANPAMARLCNVGSADEFIDGVKNLSGLFVNSERVADFNRILRKDGVVQNFETQLRCRDGAVKWVSVNARVVTGKEGQPLYYEGTFRDISERKKLESELLHSQKMQAIGTLAGGIAHDINNILMGIQGYVSLILHSEDASNPNHQRLVSIEELVRSGANLTKQLLGFARGGKYEVRPIDLNEVIGKTSAMFGRTKKELTIRVNLGENIHAVEADRGQIEQALLNLYLNAWQAMPGGGTLYLETQNISLDERTARSRSVESGPYVVVSVRDTGTGMDSKTKERIFEPFFTTKVMGRGTGLGLASVYGIIKNHGGFINVHSEKGHGSTFSIYLPASKKAIIQNNMPAPAIISGTETILVVDDEGAIASVCKELLEVIGYKAIVAGNGREAVEIYRARREEIALVILDMIMPDMGGAETLRLLKEINPNGKVILSSGYSMDGQAEGVLIKGCEAFIQKPFDIHKLSRKIRDVLDQ